VIGDQWLVVSEDVLCVECYGKEVPEIWLLRSSDQWTVVSDQWGRKKRDSGVGLQDSGRKKPQQTAAASQQ
jgi:hypothetical protein